MFSVQTSGQAIWYWWQRGSDPVADGPNLSTYTTPPVVQADDGCVYQVEVDFAVAERTIPMMAGVREREWW